MIRSMSFAARIAGVVGAALAAALALASPAAAGESPALAIQNPGARSALDLGGPWHVIPDPYEAGYFSHRYEPRADGYFMDRRPTHPSDLVEYDFRAAPTLQVPGDWNSQDPRYFLYEGTMWYFRAFELQPRPQRHYALHFGAANYEARVWLNGQYLGRHEGGFTPFGFDAGRALRAGENVLIVKVDNRRARDQVPTVNTDWWNYGGLTRPVRLLDLPAAYVADYRVRLSPEGGIRAWVKTHGGAAGQLVGFAIPELGLRVEAETDPEGMARFDQAVEPERWSPDRPRLYDLELTFGEDSVRDRIGFRTIETRGEDILLNGEPLFLRGICMHEEPIGREGRAWSEADARALLGEAIALGANFVRLAHYPHNENMLRVADELGLMVWAEIPVYWTVDFDSAAVFEKARDQLTEMIMRDANRASVVLWSVANETPLSESRQRFLAALAAHARTLDPTRLVTAALDTQTTERDRRIVEDPLADIVDVIGINNYCGWYSGVPAECAGLRWSSSYGKPIIMSEFGGGALQGLHGEEAQRWTEEYQAAVYRYNLEMIDGIEALRGMTPWILKDFRSPRRPLAGIQDFWNRKGLLSEDGQRKAAWQLLHDYYAKKAAE